MVTVLMVRRLFHVLLENGVISLVSNLSLNVMTVPKDSPVRTKTYHTLFSLTLPLVRKNSTVRRVLKVALYVLSGSHVLLGHPYQWSVPHIIIKMRLMEPSSVNLVKLNGFVLMASKKVMAKLPYAGQKKSHVLMDTTVRQSQVIPPKAVFHVLLALLAVSME